MTGQTNYPDLYREACKRTSQLLQQIEDQRKQLRDEFAMHASTDDLPIPSKLADIAAYIGVSVEEYNYFKHWPSVVAKARYEFSDAMMAAREVTP